MAEAEKVEDKPADKLAWPMVYRLEKPVEVFGEKHFEITLREPTVADFLKFRVLDDGLDGERMLPQAFRLSEFREQFPGCGSQGFSLS